MDDPSERPHRATQGTRNAIGSGFYTVKEFTKQDKLQLNCHAASDRACFIQSCTDDGGIFFELR